MKRLALMLMLGLVACSRDDETFGRSFDACVLKHDASDSAKEICQRHFTRKPTGAETAWVRRSGSIELKLNEEGNLLTSNKPWDKIEIIVPNPTSDDVVVTNVRVTATFYSDATKTKPLPGMPLVWDDLAYSIDGDSIGTFQGDKAPSPYMNAFVEPTKVYSHTGR